MPLIHLPPPSSFLSPAAAAVVGPNVKSLAVYAGLEPDSFLHLFPPAVRKEQGACYHLNTGKVYGQADCISTLIDKLDNMKFSLEELRKRPRPPDLDTTRLETYLSEEDFEVSTAFCILLSGSPLSVLVFPNNYCARSPWLISR
ncbi:unnamed protein product [Dibothriocephalus latus]|uniref:Uncharacterized protein n=1 Tax=Dibothriocephalus latus TaxID=60516 RepID=A0A3P7N9X3_DIBLA|nr:unnamed protein product [Dibothriocephalus latus]